MFQFADLVRRYEQELEVARGESDKAQKAIRFTGKKVARSAEKRAAEKIVDLQAVVEEERSRSAGAAKF